MGSNFSLFGEGLQATLRFSVAYLLLVLFFLLNVVAFVHPMSAVMKPPLLLMAIYYWSVHRPTLIPVWLVFLGGCLLDVMIGVPVGFNAAVFVLLQWIAIDQRRFLMGQPFMALWLGFCFVSLVAMLMQWVFAGLFMGGWVSLLSLAGPYLISCMIFPLVYAMLHMTHKIMPTPPAAISLKGK